MGEVGDLFVRCMGYGYRGFTSGDFIFYILGRLVGLFCLRER